MIHLTRLADGASLLYTGDFKLRPSLTAEPARPLPADTVIMECTFGRPHFCFPPLTDTAAAIQRWCRNALDHGETPILLGYSLGKAQEIQALLSGGHFPIAVPPPVAAMNRAYQSLGVPLPPWELYRGDPRGRVLVFPPQSASALHPIAPKLTALLSGWALSPAARFSYHVDAAFPLSDHADYPELLELLELTRPHTVLATHGDSAAFTRDLRQRGWNAWSLAGSDQLELSLPSTLPSPAPAPPEPSRDGSFGAFGTLCETLAATSGRPAQIALLADHFRLLADPAALATSARFLAAQSAADPTLRLSPAILRHALRQASGLPAAAFKILARSQAHLGDTACLALQNRSAPQPWTLQEMQHLFDRLHLASGPSAQAELLAHAFLHLSPRSARHALHILTGHSAAALKEGLLEDALAAAFHRSPLELRAAHLLSGDIGETAQRAQTGSTAPASLHPFRPLAPMLPSPAPASFGKTFLPPPHPALWLEPKAEGSRAQLHRTSARASLFSPTLRSLDLSFSAFLQRARSLDRDVILDGQLLPSPHPPKPSRAHADLFLPDAPPQRFLVFDLLWLDGQTLLHLPLEDRRRCLETLVLPPGFQLSAVYRAASPKTLDAARQAAQAQGHPHLIAKDPASPYTPGQRSPAWLVL